VSAKQRTRKLASRVARSLPRPVRRLLLAAKLRLEERSRAREISRTEANSGPHKGLPVPPPMLRVAVAGPNAPREAWLEVGEIDADRIRGLASRHGYEMGAMSSVLDFGCGCGRVARYWAHLSGPAIHGADTSREQVRWCQKNLPFMRAVRIDPLPPLPYGSAEFDFVYAVSVFTHLPEDSGRAWVKELVRVLKPGGLLLFTVHGERFLGAVTEREKASFRSGHLVTRGHPELAGSNRCGAFHPVEYVMGDLLPAVDVDLIEAVHDDPAGKRGISPMQLQDSYLVRKSGSTRTQTATSSRTLAR
jgi:SAM-dependent methyltransferase